MTERAKYPSDAAERFQLRMPEGLRDRIAAVAKRNNRSMNTEIVQTLENCYPQPIGRERVMEALEIILQRLKENPDADISWHLRLSMPEIVETVAAGSILDTDQVEIVQFGSMKVAKAMAE